MNLRWLSSSTPINQQERFLLICIHYRGAAKKRPSESPAQGNTAAAHPNQVFFRDSITRQDTSDVFSRRQRLVVAMHQAGMRDRTKPRKEPTGHRVGGNLQSFQSNCRVLDDHTQEIPENLQPKLCECKFVCSYRPLHLIRSSEFRIFTGVQSRSTA